MKNFDKVVGFFSPSDEKGKTLNALIVPREPRKKFVSLLQYSQDGNELQGYSKNISERGYCLHAFKRLRLWQRTKIIKNHMPRTYEVRWVKKTNNGYFAGLMLI